MDCIDLTETDVGDGPDPYVPETPDSADEQEPGLPPPPVFPEAQQEPDKDSDATQPPPPESEPESEPLEEKIEPTMSDADVIKRVHALSRETLERLAIVQQRWIKIATNHIREELERIGEEDSKIKRRKKTMNSLLGNASYLNR